MKVEALLASVQAATWQQRVAAIRSVPSEFPGKDHQAVYAAVAKSFYVDHLGPHFHMVPWPENFRDRAGFLAGYRAAEAATDGFSKPSAKRIEKALTTEPRSLRTFRLILGYLPRELSEAVRVFQGATLGVSSINRMEAGGHVSKRVAAVIPVLARLISEVVSGKSGYEVSDELRDRGFLGKTDKPDTQAGWASVSKFATEGVPYHEFLYQRWYGGAFRQLQDAGGSFKGDILEDATEQLFADNGVPYVRTVPGTQTAAGKQFGVTVTPAPDFILHDGHSPRGLLECKSASDGGTARDKAGRFGTLRAEAHRLGGIPVLAVLEGFGWRRLNDALGPVVRDCDGRVFMPDNLAELLDVDPVHELLGLAKP